jgi:type I restriction enzyme S subunit
MISNAAVNQSNFNASRTAQVTIALPPLAEQYRVVEEVERRLSLADEAETQIETNHRRTERLRQSILGRAFEGKLIEQNASDEPASLLLERIRGTANPGCAPPTRSPRGSRRKPLRAKEPANA